MAGVALGGRLCVLGPREVIRGQGRQSTGGLQLNREASSVSRWGTQLRPLEYMPVSHWPRSYLLTRTPGNFPGLGTAKRGQVSPYLVPEWHKLGF